VSATGTFIGDGSGLTGVSGIDGDYLPLSGGTVTGDTYFTSGLSAFSFSGDDSNLTSVTATNVITDHGNLLGLIDNDHPQYSLTSHLHPQYTLTADMIGYSLTSHIHDGLYVPASGGTFDGTVYGTFNGDGSSLTSLS